MSRWVKTLSDGSILRVSPLLLEDSNGVAYYAGEFRCHKCNKIHDAELWHGDFTSPKNEKEVIKFPVMQCHGEYIVAIAENKIK